MDAPFSWCTRGTGAPGPATTFTKGNQMLHFMQRLVAGREDEKGASAVEYGLMVAAIAAIVIAIVFSLGGVVKGVFKKSCDDITGKVTVTATCANT
jgi:pilus assembly protein Flp/PilA